MQSVQVPEGGKGPAAVQIGDMVEVRTRGGEVRRFKVTEVAEDALVGDDVRIAYADIAELKAAPRSAGGSRTAVWVIGGVALLALLIGAAGGGGSSY